MASFVTVRVEFPTEVIRPVVSTKSLPEVFSTSVSPLEFLKLPAINNPSPLLFVTVKSPVFCTEPFKESLVPLALFVIVVAAPVPPFRIMLPVSTSSSPFVLFISKRPFVLITLPLTSNPPLPLFVIELSPSLLVIEPITFKAPASLV